MHNWYPGLNYIFRQVVGSVTAVTEARLQISYDANPWQVSPAWDDSIYFYLFIKCLHASWFQKQFFIISLPGQYKWRNAWLVSSAQDLKGEIKTWISDRMKFLALKRNQTSFLKYLLCTATSRFDVGADKEPLSRWEITPASSGLPTEVRSALNPWNLSDWFWKELQISPEAVPASHIPSLPIIYGSR